MSFERHRQIYQSDGPWAGRETSPALEKPGATLAAAPGAHRLDEFAAGYSLAGCSPAEPASASPAQASVRRYSEEGKRFAVNRNLSRFRLSHAWGSLQTVGGTRGTESLFPPKVQPLAVRCPFAVLAPASIPQRGGHAVLIIRWVRGRLTANFLDRQRPVSGDPSYGVFDDRVLAPVQLAMLRLKVHQGTRKVRPLALAIERQPFRRQPSLRGSVRTRACIWLPPVAGEREPSHLRPSERTRTPEPPGRARQGQGLPSPAVASACGTV